jgi:dipeptidyl aminopeptidase/acylaminoacyl peptidase
MIKRKFGFSLFVNFLLLIILLSPGYVNGQSETSEHLIPRQVLFSDPDKATVKISPDGKRISYRAPHENSMSLWIAPVNDAKNFKAVLKPDAAPVINYEWAFTTKHVLYLKPAGTGVHLFSLDLDKNESRDLTPFENVTARIEKLSPEIPEEAVISMNRRDARIFDLFRVNLLTGELKSVRQNEGFSRFFLDNQFRPRAAVRFGEDGGYELFKPNENGQWTRFYSIPIASVAAGSQPLAVNGSGTELYVIDNTDSNTVVLKSFDLETGKYRILVEEPLADLLPALMQHPKTGQAQSVVAAYSRNRRHYVDRSVAVDFDSLKSIAKNADIGVVSRSLDENIWLSAFFDGGPPHYYLYNRQTKTATFLFTEYPQLQKYNLAKRQGVVFTTRDGLKLPGDVYLPSWVETNKSGLPKKPLPTILVVHGGPALNYPWNSWTTNQMLQLLANRGYAAFRVEFRGTGGFGKKILEAGNLQWGAKMNDDLLDAAEWAATHGIADRQRTGIMGWSYGGYATIAALTFSPETFACGFSMYGPTDLTELVSSREEFVRPFWRNLIGDERTEKGLEWQKAHSPVYFVEQIKKPLLITHGKQDRIVAISHSDKFVEAMKKAKKSVTYLVYDDEGHDYTRKENLVSLFAVAEKFFYEHLGGRFEP